MVRSPEEIKFNSNSLEKLKNISDYYNISLDIYPKIDSKFSVGIEIEIKFKYFFPEIYDKYFKNKKWSNYNKNEQNIITEIITKEEESKKIKEKLNKVQDFGIEKGKDCYWEFALDPVYDLSIIISQIKLLNKLELIPIGNHSLHLTIGNIEKGENYYWLLLLTELLFSSRKRLLSGANKDKRSTYFRKGEAGLLEKHWRLKGCKTAVEFRTLEIVVDIDNNISFTHEKLSLFSKLLNNSEYLKSKISECKKLLADIGLPIKNWKNYKDNFNVWDSYYENFDRIKNELLLDEF